MKNARWRRWPLLAALLFPIAACAAEDATVLSQLCADMSGSAKKGVRYDDALISALKSASAARPSAGLSEQLSLMRQVSSRNHVPMLRKLALGKGQKFDCPGWEYRLGAPKSERIAQPRGHVGSIAVYRGALYWLEEGKLFRAQLDGSQATLLHQVRPEGEDGLGNGDLMRMQIAGDTLYWLAGERVFRMNLGTSKIEELGRTGHGQELALAGEGLYLTDGSGIVRLNLATRARELVAEAQGDPKYLFVSGGNVFWADRMVDLRRMKLAPSGPIETLAKLYEASGFLRTADGFWILDLTLRRVDATKGSVVEEVPTKRWKDGYPASAASDGTTTWAAFYGGPLAWPNTGSIARVTFAAEPQQQTVDTGFEGANHLALGEGWLFWADANGIYRTPSTTKPH
jgi:hypothetical protein